MQLLRSDATHASNALFQATRMAGQRSHVPRQKKSRKQLVQRSPPLSSAFRKALEAHSYRDTMSLSVHPKDAVSSL